MKSNPTLALTVALTTIVGAGIVMAIQAGAGRSAAPPRPQGPCDIYAAAGDPCVAAHSTTRALYAAYNGPLYQVLRQSDGKTLDIGVVRRREPTAGGYANAAAQDAFCANTYCFISKIYDQSDKHNDLTQAPRGGFSGPAMGGFNNLPIADMAPVTVMGHKVYGVFIEPGMGLRNDDPKGTAVDDQAEGQYWVINGLHYNSGCCFDYGNAETDSRDDGNGTMETTYYGNATGWYHGIRRRAVDHDGPGEQPRRLRQRRSDPTSCARPAEHHVAIRDRDGQGRAASLDVARRRRAAGRAESDVRRTAHRRDATIRCASRARSCSATAATTASARRARSTKAR